MPRYKQVNHKGKSREFTPVEELQQDLDDYLNGTSLDSALASSNDDGEETSDDEDQGKNGHLLRRKGVQSLIEISNPNRSKPPSSWKDEVIEDPEKVPSRQPCRGREWRRNQSTRSTETQADLARLALVRQERQIAAQQRLDIKKSSSASHDRSSSISSNGGAHFLKNLSKDRSAKYVPKYGPTNLNHKAMLKKK